LGRKTSSVRKVFFIYLFPFLLFLFVSPPDSRCDEVKEEWNKALSSYSEGDYPEALSRFEALVRNFPQDRRFSIFKLMLAKCQYHMQNYVKAEKSFGDFLDDFPQSRFIPSCHFYLGNIKYVKGELLGSAWEFVQALEGDDQKTKELALKSLVLLLKSNLEKDQLEELARKTEGKEIHPEVLFFWGKKELNTGSHSRAKEIFENYLQTYPGAQRAKKAREYSEQLSYLLEEGIGIGILAPLSGPYAEYGESMTRGIKLALEDSERKVKLFIRDTQGDPVQAALLSRRLIEEDGVSVIVGPLRSECTIGASATAQIFKVPLITPTSNQEGIADLGDFIFQFSPSTRKIGEAVARFAVKELDIKDVVMISPDDSYGQDATLGFQGEAEESGAEILIQEVYTPGSTDFGPQLKKIRELLWEKKMEREGGFDSTKYVDKSGEPIPPDEIPVEVDGFFLPVYPQDIALISPQIAFFKIQTKLLGTEGWGQKEILNLSRQFTDGVVFASDFYQQENSSFGRNFKEDFELSFRKAPDKAAFLSYFSMRFLLAALKNASAPEDIRSNLLKIKGVKEIENKIDLGPGGENTSIGIYLFQNGEIERVK
jgi:branched-chain amino acid transport system substrate-binding protein